MNVLATHQKGRSSLSPSLAPKSGTGGAGTALGTTSFTGAAATGVAAGAFPSVFSAFQPRMLVYQRPLYSRLSMSKLKVTVSPTSNGYWLARSPKKSKCIFLGKFSIVSSTYSCLVQAFPAFEHFVLNLCYAFGDLQLRYQLALHVEVSGQAMTVVAVGRGIGDIHPREEVSAVVNV